MIFGQLFVCLFVLLLGHGNHRSAFVAEAALVTPRSELSNLGDIDNGKENNSKQMSRMLGAKNMSAKKSKFSKKSKKKGKKSNDYYEPSWKQQALDCMNDLNDILTGNRDDIKFYHALIMFNEQRRKLNENEKGEEKEEGSDPKVAKFGSLRMLTDWKEKTEECYAMISDAEKDVTDLVKQVKTYEEDSLFAQSSAEGCTIKSAPHTGSKNKYYVYMTNVHPNLYKFQIKPSYTSFSKRLVQKSEEFYLDHLALLGDGPAAALSLFHQQSSDGSNPVLIAGFLDNIDLKYNYDTNNVTSYILEFITDEDLSNYSDLTIDDGKIENCIAFYSFEAESSSESTKGRRFLDLPNIEVLADDLESSLGRLSGAEEAIIQNDFNPPSIAKNAWQQIGSKKGKDAIAGFIRAGTALVDLTRTCLSSGCDNPAEIANQIGRVLTVVGGALTKFFPPAGLIIASIGLAVQLISAFFGPGSGIVQRRTLDRVEVENAVRRAMTDIYGQFANDVAGEFNEIVDSDLRMFSDFLFSLRMTESNEKKKESVRFFYTDVYTRRFDALQDGISNLNTNARRVLRNRGDSQRSGFLNWIDNCDNCWLRAGTDRGATLIRNGYRELQDDCRTKVTDQIRPWNVMTEFMQSYGASGNLVGIWYHQTLEMFCSLDECDCSDDNVVTGNLGANCPPWARLAIFNNRQVLRDRIEDRAFVIGDTAQIMGGVCEVDSPRFPWHQSCNNDHCNFVYLVMIDTRCGWRNRSCPGNPNIGAHLSRLANVPGVSYGFPQELAGFSFRSATRECQAIFDRFDFCFQGACPVLAMNVNRNSGFLYAGNCGNMNTDVIGRDATVHRHLLAIANFCPESNDCRGLFANDASFGDW